MNLVGSILQESSFVFRRLQTGLIQNYALLMLFGVFAFVSLYLVAADGSRYESSAVADPVHAAGRRRGADVREQAQRERHPLDREPLRAGRVPRVAAALVLRTTSPNPAYQFVERAQWIPSIGAWYYLGVDGFAALLILLTTLMGVIAILSSWTAITERVKEYYIFLLLLQTGMIGAFVSLDFLLFFLFWEVMLVPMYFLIGIWGSDRRLYSAIKFFLYTLVGSVVMLLGILALYFSYTDPQTGQHTFDIVQFQQHGFDTNLQWWVFLAFFLGFSIKVPMFPFHTWLPDAHTDAPTAGSVILAAVLLKMGTYGFIRFSLPILPDATRAFVPMIAALSIIGIVYGALVAMAQRDWKRLVAYSSVSHMALVMLGMFALNPVGIKGSIIQQINHGISTGALFLIVGIVYERRHTRMISEYGGLSKVMPVYAAIFCVMMLSSIGLPALNGFIGEFLILQGDLHGQQDVGGRRRERHRPGRGLHAVALPAHDVREDREPEEREPEGPEPPRGDDVRAADHPGGLDRHLPDAVPRPARHGGGQGGGARQPAVRRRQGGGLRQQAGPVEVAGWRRAALTTAAPAAATPAAGEPARRLAKPAGGR